jgi:hypothetical protein
MMSGMEASATIVVTGGPDAGKSYALADELVHIGRGRDNQVVLSDEGLAEHQASIVRRNGRYAIYAPQAGSVQVEGSDIPAEKWVWLPQAATIKLAGTVFRLEAAQGENGASATPAPESTPTPTPGKSRPKTTPPGAKKEGSERAKKKARPAEKQPQVARFISDRTGEPLVRLGEDGQLPALELAELAEEAPQERRQKSTSNPLLLYGLIGFSFVASLGMLLIDPNAASTSSTTEQAKARSALHEFYGAPGSRLERYQELLRLGLVCHSQGDWEGERGAYREVLQMLNAADIRDPKRHPNGLTGKQTKRGRDSDDDLREALETLLAN